MNRDYPEGWTLTVHEVISEGDQVAARVCVAQGADLFWCTGFYTVDDGVITDGVEHWLTEGAEAAPAWRAPYRTA